MPFRNVKLKDPITKKDVLDENGEPVYEDEKFLSHFLGNTKEESESLYKEYITTLTGLANKYSMYSGVDEGDLKQEGIIGLARAMRDFDGKRSDDFNTFAMYKIKDAMREFVAKQATDIQIPQYIKEATRLINKLSKLLEKVNPLKEHDFSQVWSESQMYDDKSEIIKDINDVRDSLLGLASRSGTTVDRLLSRAELYPADVTDVDDVVCTMGDMSNISTESAEDDIVSQIMAYKSVDKLRDILSKDEYDLLYSHFVDGMTVRQLAPIYGITAATITIRIHNILDVLSKKKEQILML